MSIRSEREKSKMQEKYQTILAQMLKEDDNRFCVDCDTKSNKNNHFQIYYYDLFFLRSKMG